MIKNKERKSEFDQTEYYSNSFVPVPLPFRYLFVPHRSLGVPSLKMSLSPLEVLGHLL